MELTIKSEDAQKILDYLVQHPYSQVHELVKILMSLETVKEDQ